MNDAPVKDVEEEEKDTQTGNVKTEKYLSSRKKIPESFSLRQAKLVYICLSRGLSLPHHDLIEHPLAVCWLSDGWSFYKRVTVSLTHGGRQYLCFSEGQLTCDHLSTSFTNHFCASFTHKKLMSLSIT